MRAEGSSKGSSTTGAELALVGWVCSRAAGRVNPLLQGWGLVWARKPELYNTGAPARGRLGHAQLCCKAAAAEKICDFIF